MTGIKKKVSKVLLSSTMILIMACSIVPINVLAEETNDGPSKEGKEITQSINIPQVKSISKRTSLLDLQDSNYILDKDGKQITSSGGVFDVMNSEGWMFDSNTQTLTLNGANFDTNTNPSILMPREPGAKVVLTGTNNISNSNTSAIDMSIYPLTIEGDGTLIANTKQVCIAASEGLIINGGTFDLTSSNSDALYSPFGDVIISSGKLELSTVKGNGIFTEKNIVLSGGSVNANSYYCAMRARGTDGIKIDNATVIANSTKDYGIWAKESLTITNNSDVTSTGVKGGINAGTSVTIEPTINKCVDVFAGDQESNAKLLSGAPFSTKTDLIALNIASNLYFHSKTHSHVASTTWSKDATSHWHECTANDGEKMDVAFHTFGDWVIGNVATETTKGSKHRDCTVCGQREVVEIPSPVITAGAGSTHQISNGKDMTLTCSGELENLTGIYVDGKLLDKNNYTLETGSTILKLKSSYLDTLSTGKHTLKFQYRDNASAETDFIIATKEAPKNDTVIKDTASPKTGDNSTPTVYVFLLLLSGCAVGTALFRRKKNFNK